MLGFAAWAVVSAGRGVLSVGVEALQALWLLPPLAALHLCQLLLSARAWQCLLPPHLPLPRCYRLRIIREGIDSLLPVAQVGGEIVGARLLAFESNLPVAITGASIVVDVTLEFLTQLAFLISGIAVLAIVSPDGAWEAWLGAALLIAVTAAGLIAAQKVGLLRLVESLAKQIAARWPAAGALVGMNEAVTAIYANRAALLRSGGLHLIAWLLGSIESWAVLNALGNPVSPAAALIVEALGMAARSAGFAVPGALVVQETGFAVAAAAIGLPQATGVSLSLVKRAREVLVGLIGLALWRLALQRDGAHPRSDPA